MSENWDLSRLSKSERVAMKRCAGKIYGQDMKSLQAFYHAARPEGLKREDIAFAVMCMECMWDPEENLPKVPLENLLYKIYKDKNTSDSTRRKIIALLDIPWGKDGFLLGKMYHFVHMIYSRKIKEMPDFEQLFEDLKKWNHPERWVQRNWIKKICNTQMNEEENRDVD